MAADAKMRKVVVTLELLTTIPLNELRVFYHQNWFPVCSGLLKVEQVQTNVIRPKKR